MNRLFFVYLPVKELVILTYILEIYVITKHACKNLKNYPPEGTSIFLTHQRLRVQIKIDPLKGSKYFFYKLIFFHDFFHPPPIASTIF